jgi:hypothetical protein
VHEENRRKEAMRSRQLAERLGVEEAHMLEYQQFNMDWDRKMGEFESHANDLVDAMRQRHQVSLVCLFGLYELTAHFPSLCVSMAGITPLQYFRVVLHVFVLLILFFNVCSHAACV